MNQSKSFKANDFENTRNFVESHYFTDPLDPRMIQGFFKNRSRRMEMGWNYRSELNPRLN